MLVRLACKTGDLRIYVLFDVLNFINQVVHPVGGTGIADVPGIVADLPQVTNDLVESVHDFLRSRHRFSSHHPPQHPHGIRLQGRCQRSADPPIPIDRVRPSRSILGALSVQP
jgi:hypothetical protein